MDVVLLLLSVVLFVLKPIVLTYIVGRWAYFKIMDDGPEIYGAEDNEVIAVE